MDVLTHSATGLFLSRAGFNRVVPQASWILLLAANAPDIDVVSAFGGGLQYLNYHRHITHAVPFLPLLALLPVAVVRLASRKPLAWGRAWLISMAGVASHLALDSTNIYGVRLLLPFSARWYRLDLTSVVDLWIWAVCLLAIAGPALARLVNSEIGAKGHPGRGFAILALAFLVLYNGGRGWLHARAVAILDARLYDGAVPLRVAALPESFNPLRWRGLVETPGFYSVQDVNLTGEFDPAQGRTFYKPAPDPALEAAARSPVVRDFLRFAQFPLWRVSPAAEVESGTLVEILDMRFGTPAQPAFVASVLLDGRLQPVRSWFQFGRVRPR